MVDFIADFTLNTNSGIEADFQINTLNTDHSVLTNRDKPEQHPIAAITGLQNALDETSEAISAEKEERIEADANLQEQIDNIIADSVTEVVGGSNIDVTRENSSVTISSSTFVYEQGIASNEWQITHNLKKCPSVALVDSAGTVFQAKIEYNDLNTLTIYLNGATTGKAYLN